MEKSTVYMNNNPNLVAGQACPRMNHTTDYGENIECKDSGQNGLQDYCRLGRSFDPLCTWIN